MSVVVQNPNAPQAVVLIDPSTGSAYIPAPQTVSSATFSLVGDNATDNNTAILAWIAAAAAAIAAGQSIVMVLQPGIYRTSGRHVIPAGVDIRFNTAVLRAIGTDVTSPLLTVTGQALDVYCDTSISHNYTNRNFIGFRLLDTNNQYIRVRQITGFTIGFQIAASANSCAYNTIDIGGISVCTQPVECCCLTNTTNFPSENKINGGNIIATSGLNNMGSLYAFTMASEFDAGYHGHSGNSWYKPSFQMAGVGLSWTSGGSATANRRYYGPITGNEWYCKTAGTFSATEPSLIPTVAAGTRVDLTSITTVAGDANITVSSTAGISAGWHMRGTNPLSNFPFDTYVTTVTDGTHLLMSNPAQSSSSSYKAYFIAPTTDNTAGLIFVGPYRRSALWNRDCGSSNNIDFGRRETAVGEAVINSGPYLFPQAASGAQTYESKVTLESESTTTAKINLFPKWAVNTAYLHGDMVSPATAGSFFWESIGAGTSHASTEPTMVGKAGTTTADNTVTWIERTMPTTVDRGDIGTYTGFTTEPKTYVSHYTRDAASTFALDNLHLRAIGSATGWLVKGACKNTTAGALAQSWASTDFALSREGLLLLATASQIGFLIRTDKHKYYRYRKHFGSYTSQRGRFMAFDKAVSKMNCYTSHSGFNPRILSNMTVSGSFDVADTSDGVVTPANVLVGIDTPYIFYGVVKGTTGTPVACTLNGLSVTALSYETTEFIAPRVEAFSPFGAPDMPRASLGIPTSGYFKTVGEYIVNDSYLSGATPKGYIVKTAGILAPTWLTSTAYVKGQLVVGNSGADLLRVYASNGSFTSGTAPTGTTLNQVDGTATGITAGDVATWDYMGVLAVLDADEDSQTLFAAGNAGATPTPNCQSGLRQSWTQSANMTVAAPTNPPSVGSTLSLLFTSNGTWTTAWNATYRNAPAWIASANGQKATATFMYDGTNWQFIGGSTVFA